MGSAENGSKAYWLLIAAPVFVIAVLAATCFPVVHFGDNQIRVFTLQRVGFDGRWFEGRVFGDHVLETEYGEIRLNRRALISADNVVHGRRTDSYHLSSIRPESFFNGLASHTLVVEGITIPPNVKIWFDSNQRISLLEIAFPDSALVRYFQEIEVSGIPLMAGRINFARPGATADIEIDPLWPDYIELADATIIDFTPIAAPDLHIYKEDALWRISGRTAVKSPGETEFTMYRSITFRPHWGEFIEGELVE
ncbi:MAG: hypothetical protein FWC64_05355 [Treponema sp.]|nr:hypothetical protein [Treponema sp.]